MNRYLPWLVDLFLVALILVNLWHATDLPSDPYVPVPREHVRHQGDQPQVHVGWYQSRTTRLAEINMFLGLLAGIAHLLSLRFRSCDDETAN
jgi:hypothetical protein